VLRRVIETAKRRRVIRSRKQIKFNCARRAKEQKRASKDKGRGTSAADRDHSHPQKNRKNPLTLLIQLCPFPQTLLLLRVTKKTPNLKIPKILQTLLMH